MKSNPVSLVLAVAALGGSGEPARGQAFDHAALDTVLALYVQDSRVDYTALKYGRATLDRYLDRLAAVDADEFAGWPEAEQIAYLINAYNAYVLETVIDNYPIEGSGFFKKLTSPRRFGLPPNSIRHIDGVFNRIRHGAAGAEMTLDEIKRAALGTKYNEPRIHFALVGSAVSGPPLREEAYRGDRLDEQLDEQGRRFLNDPRKNRFEVERRRVYLSKIFDWHGEDFEQFAGESGYERDRKIDGVLNFVSRYLIGRVTEFLESEEYKVQFESYDWTLNDQAVAASIR
ncbi:MAG: DUF547 domain-containing protein [Gemmatimonadota bacterium]|nr:MAG: DUF547 domain-containing protein [Gemmatimonadota bacterium]